MNDIFNDFMALFGFGKYEAPPPEVPLRILGLLPGASQETIRKAFRAKVIEVHPDLKPAFDNPDFQDMAQQGRGDLPEIRELVWARDCALQQAPQPVTDSGGVAVDPLSTVTTPERKYFKTEIGEPYICRLCGAPLRPPARIRYRGGYNIVEVFYCDSCFEGKKETEHGYWNSTLRRCEICGVGMSVKRSGKYCSWQCQNKGYAKQRREQRAERRENITCEICGEAFTPKRADAKYCSPACRQRAYREREVTSDAAE